MLRDLRNVRFFVGSQTSMKLISIVRIFTLIFFLAVAGIIFIADTKNTRYVLSFVGNIPFGDKLGHFFLLGLLSALVSWSLNFRRIGIVLTGSLIVGIAAFAEEISQIYIRGRSFDVTDLIADFLGIVILSELANYMFTSIWKKD